MSGICDTCRRKPCPAEGEGLKYCDFYKNGELKSCPFCGGEAKRSKETYGTMFMSWIYCTSCGAQGAPRHIEAEAIDAWNARAERTCHNTWDVELTGRLRFVCSECGGVSLEIAARYCPICGAKVVGE